MQAKIFAALKHEIRKFWRDFYQQIFEAKEKLNIWMLSVKAYVMLLYF